MSKSIKVRNEPAQHIGVANSAPCPEMNIITKEITENGRYEARTEGVTGFDPVIVNVPSREEIGYENGYAAGYDEGYDKGYEVAGENSVTSEDLTFTDKTPYLFQFDNWSQMIKRFGHMMQFNAITDAASLFNHCTAEDLSNLTINFDEGLLGSAFSWCNNLKKLPTTSGSIYCALSSMFNLCYNLTSDEVNKFFEGLTYKYSRFGSPSSTSMFSSCYSLRDLTPFFEWFDAHLNSYDGTSTDIFGFSSLLSNVKCLDEVTNFPVVRLPMAKTGNAFSSTFSNCNRIKNMIFRTDNAQPYSVNWKSQTIDLSGYIGYARTEAEIINYNSGITSDKRVRNASTYESLKNDPDWYTTDYSYSRYNHDSAVNTINSLPDTSEYLASAGGTNTIQFKGTSGSKTDGGAISNLTAEEIAVATAKGWTVTFA